MKNATSIISRQRGLIRNLCITTVAVTTFVVIFTTCSEEGRKSRIGTKSVGNREDELQKCPPGLFDSLQAGTCPPIWCMCYAPEHAPEKGQWRTRYWKGVPYTPIEIALSLRPSGYPVLGIFSKKEMHEDINRNLESLVIGTDVAIISCPEANAKGNCYRVWVFMIIAPRKETDTKIGKIIELARQRPWVEDAHVAVGRAAK